MASQQGRRSPGGVIKRKAWWEKLLFWQKNNRRIAPSRGTSITQTLTENKEITSQQAKQAQEEVAVVASSRWYQSALFSLLRITGVLMGTLLITGGGYGIYYLLYKSPHFTLQTIRFEKTVYLTHVTKESLLERVQVPKGSNLWNLSIEDMEAILAQEPWLARVQIRRQWPDTLVIDVAEHKPRLLVELDALYLVNEQDVIFKKADEQESKQYPKLLGLKRDKYQSKPEELQEWIHRANLMVELYQRTASPIRPRLAEIQFKTFRVDQSIDVQLKTQNAIEIWLPWGNGDEISQKFKYLDVTLEKLLASKQRPATIFLNTRAHPDRVTVQPRDLSLEES